MQRPLKKKEKKGCKTNSEKGHGTLGRKQQKMWGRWRGGSEEEKEKEQQEKEQQRSCGVSQRKSKVRPFSQRGRTSAQERPAKPDTGAVAAATRNESIFTSLMEKMVEKQKNQNSSYISSHQFLVFGDVINLFKFLDFNKNLKIGRSSIGKMCIICALLHYSPPPPQPSRNTLLRVREKQDPL